ncbi:MAG: enoyl-CoA hydratase [Granulosicoccaceae bacterium]
MSYENIKVEQRGSVCVIELHRPKALNALSKGLMDDLTAALDVAEADSGTRAIVVTGSEKAFAAGADIKEFQNRDFSDVYRDNLITANWERIDRCRKPVIAAVAGFALGGGCEVAMMCDFILAADNAVFGQPEIKLGIVPGAGGSQRLTRAVGKAKAMELVLTGRNMKAEEAERSGLVARVVPLDSLMDEAIKTAETIASYSQPAVMMAKDLVKTSQQVGLDEGVKIERRVFHACFGTHHQVEGMAAFAEKRKPDFKE